MSQAVIEFPYKSLNGWGTSIALPSGVRLDLELPSQAEAGAASHALSELALAAGLAEQINFV